MPTLVRSLLLLLVVSALFAPAASLADPIAASVTVVGTGEFGGRAFTDTPVTVTIRFTSEEFAACPTGSCAGGGFITINGLWGATGTVTVAGIGTSGYASGLSNPAVYLYNGSLAVTDEAGLLELNVDSPLFTESFAQSVGPVTGPTTNPVLGDSCTTILPVNDCPVHIDTDLGALVLTSIGPSATGEIVVGSAPGVTPEPATWVMVGSGLAAIWARRRLRPRRTSGRTA